VTCGLDRIGSGRVRWDQVGSGGIKVGSRWDQGGIRVGSGGIRSHRIPSDPIGSQLEERASDGIRSHQIPWDHRIGSVQIAVRRLLPHRSREAARGFRPPRLPCRWKLSRRIPCAPTGIRGISHRDLTGISQGSHRDLTGISQGSRALPQGAKGAGGAVQAGRSGSGADGGASSG
jgi:hypothetical protein